ncbi:MAG: hypothetical protein LBR26_06820 [Prevotella sp.]|nr:hypothetical protein [Prevotella sp.]
MKSASGNLNGQRTHHSTLAGIAVRLRLKAFHIPTRHNMPGKMDMPGNYVLKEQYNKRLRPGHRVLSFLA